MRETREKTGREVKEKSSAKGKGHKQQLEAVLKQLSHEEAKHLKRVARLQRIRELAEAKGNIATIERIDKLMGKEQNRYERKTRRMLEREQRILALTEQALEQAKKSEAKGKDKAAKDKSPEDKEKDDDAEKD